MVKWKVNSTKLLRRDVVDEIDRVCNSFDFRFVTTLGLGVLDFDGSNVLAFRRFLASVLCDLSVDTDRARDPLLIRICRRSADISSEIDRIIFGRGAFDFVVFVHFVLWEAFSDTVGVRERNDFLFESFAVHTFSRQILSRSAAPEIPDFVLFLDSTDSVDFDDFGGFEGAQSLCTDWGCITSLSSR